MSETSSSSENSQPNNSHIGPSASLLFLPRHPQEIAVAICIVGLLASFCFPWGEFRPVGSFTDRLISGANFRDFVQLGAALWIIPLSAMATLAAYRNPAAKRRLGTATAILTQLLLAIFVFWLQNLNHGKLREGAFLTQCFAFGLFAFSGRHGVTSTIDLAARKLGSRKAEVFSHWGSVTPGVHFSADGFYEQLETAIRTKMWPGVQLFRIKYTEAGMLSHKREYLRIIRQRHLFDVCAATFGKDYFFSLREAQLPVVITLRTVFVVLIGLNLAGSLFVHLFGILGGPPIFLFFVIFSIWFLFNILKLGLTRLDSILIQLPAIGPIYEMYFRKETYFQQDTRLVFLQSVSELVREHVEEATSSKGIQLLKCFEKQPILEGLYTRYRVDLTAKPETVLATR